VEIYQERIRDLLSPTTPGSDNLQVGEEAAGGGVYIKGVSEFYVTSPEEMGELMRQGAENRATSATGMNAGSSRSHSLFLISLAQSNRATGTSTSGKLYLVDLAGSETVSKTGVSGQQLEELKKINKSLSTLGNVINALTDGKSTHVPYRDSKLTRVLQECLGGNAKTALLIACSPSAYNEVESLSTLRFGKRAKKIALHAHVSCPDHTA
jgi:kinesin family protein 5